MVQSELLIKMYEEIQSLMVLMADDIANPSYWELNFDEVLADLHLKMVEIVVRYEDKPWAELKAIVIRSLRNHKVTLTRRVYGTHRSLELGAEDIDELDDSIGGSVSLFSIDEFMESLSSDDARLLSQEVLQPSDRTLWFIKLTEHRKQATTTKNQWRLSITPLMMERAMGWSQERLEQAWNEISGTLRHISENV